MATKYVSKFKVKLKREKGGEKVQTSLIWGDPVRVLQESGDFVKVRARKQYGWLAKSDICDEGLLEIYVIDVGQGDGVLMRTPDDKWHLIDAGVPGAKQMTKKGAANFIHWKFIEELELDKVSLSSVIVTHPDYDHYGGLLDVLAGKQCGDDDFQIEVKNFYHNGMGRFKKSPEMGKYVKNETVAPFPNGDHGIARTDSFITELLDGADSFRTPPRDLKGNFADLAELVADVPNNVQRLSNKSKFLPGYKSGNNNAVIHVLGPVLEAFSGKVGLRKLRTNSITVNGHSIVLRVDYGQARILLTGDLNAESQRLLLSYHPVDEFAVDVAKGCHHGAEDVEWEFIEAMKAKATVISSGDNEDYSHPRPSLLGGSAWYGREIVGSSGKRMPPLLYSTELARSVKLTHASRAQVDVDKDRKTPPELFYPGRVELKPEGQKKKYRPLGETPISTGLVYGLVNIRTDGKHILCATMEEKGNDFDVKVFKAG